MELKHPEMKFLRRDIDRGRRILVTSDIHGHPELLKRLLSDAGFTADDLLVIVGDIVEKGPDSLGALRLVMKLCEGGNVIPLLGNVDAWRVLMIDSLCAENAEEFYNYLESIRSWTGCLWDEMTAELGVFCKSPADVLSMKDRVLGHFRPELEFLAGLPTLLETQKYVFVHGGLCDTDIAANERRGLFELLKYDDFMTGAPVFDKYVVVGHWPVTLYSDRIACCNPIINREKHIISIDGGCGIKEYGQLNLLIIPDIDADISENTFICADELPTATALDAQKGSSDSLNIRWTDNAIETLWHKDGFRLARHISTGKTVEIPDEYAYDDTHSRDYSDYELQVEPGDILSLVKKTSRGRLAKKNGVFGWYRGRTDGASK